ncbi:hypothetical protein [Catellatospora tritici]|uniref:hypothetical protein n=1 Tax=Catellatospora tritici TaxID=2851566 RepID=UPI001C2D2358|nr:hypothetical protein [Catellatospora tritici]MBV1852078.1 hypothetical protein [Catellatospora tritici]
MWTLQQLDPDRSRRRLQLLAALSGGGTARERVLPSTGRRVPSGAARGRLSRASADRVRELIALRRRLAG